VESPFSLEEKHYELPLPEWQKEELQKRYSDFKNDKTPLHDWKSVHDLIYHRK
jgi:hypothetical protein